MADLAAVMKAYDIRGVVPDELDAPLVRALGQAAASVLGAKTPGVPMVVGHDMRPSAGSLVDAFADGVRAAGMDVVNIGLSSTEQVYFASGVLDAPGAMLTASHNPAQYNGIKLCRAGAVPVGQGSGLEEIATLAATGSEPAARRGGLTHRDTLADYARYVTGLVDLSGIRPLTVVVDAGNGMAGHTVPAVLTAPGLRLVPLYFELDGTFPNHPANPIDPATLVDLQAAVRQHGADLGLAFDGDADRCFVVDERGDVVSPSTLTALIAVRELQRNPGAAVIHNLIVSRAVPEVIAAHGGRPIRTRVGHSFIKQAMAQTDAVFGGEHSGHYYFRDFWRADSGMLAALHTLAALGCDPQRRRLSELLQPYQRYAASGEVNSEVLDTAGALAALERQYGADPATRIDRLDGLTVEHHGEPFWWFNVRPSNTEPLLRLNVEAPDDATMRRVRDDVLRAIRQPAEGDR